MAVAAHEIHALLSDLIVGCIRVVIQVGDHATLTATRSGNPFRTGVSQVFCIYYVVTFGAASRFTCSHDPHANSKL